MCPHCPHHSSKSSHHGFFTRTSDGKRFQRFKCSRCDRTFSSATYHDCYRQKKRRLNPRIYELFCSGVSLRRIAILLKIHRITVARKLLFLAAHARVDNLRQNERFKCFNEIQFDDLETIEHSKMKPLSVAMAVDKESRRILSFAVSRMPAKGLLSKPAIKKYGPRKDERDSGWLKMFSEIQHNATPDTRFRSDQNPHYAKYMKLFFSKHEHIAEPGLRGCVAGQGELKKATHDPLFTLNHTLAMCRANINRLFRKTWCTTKRPDRLAAHLELYMHYHNNSIIAS